MLQHTDGPGLGAGTKAVVGPAGRSPRAMAMARAKAKAYWALTKDLQTTLLLITGLAGYVSARCPMSTWKVIVALTGSLFLAISGSTVLNMVYDRDIDARMARTARRPLASGGVTVTEALAFGLVLSGLGVTWAFVLAPGYGLVVAAGLLLDVVVYTIWLKRRSAWSVVWGGLAGGMPVLAGRVLAVGEVDLIGVLLALAIVLWIPTHIITIQIRYADQYRSVGVPVIPQAYGERVAHLLVGVCTALAVAVMLFAGWGLGLRAGFLGVAGGTGLILFALAVGAVLHPSPRLNFHLFKWASAYMLVSMGIIMVGV